MRAVRRRRTAGRDDRSRDERGAVALIAAATMTLLLIVAALVADIGLQRVARADMQAVADVVALDLSRELDGRTAATLAPLMPSLAEQSRARNADNVGDTARVTPTLGALDAQGDFVAVSGGTVPTAVRVEATTDVPFAFGGITEVDSGSATRTSTATVSSGACFRLGSITATIDTADSALLSSFGSLVGDALGARIDALSYRGLADVFVNLGDLAAELGVGSVDELVALRSVRVTDVISATARVLASDGSSEARADAAVLVANLATRVSETLTFDVADVLSVGQTAALTAQVGVLDLITASAFAVNGDNLLDTGVLWNEPHVSSGSVQLKVIEAPQQACGLVGPQTEARTAQVQLDADLGFNLPNKIGDLSVTNATDPSTKAAILSVRARLGGAGGYLSGLRCGDAATAATAEEIRAMVSTQLSQTSVSLPFRLRGTIDTKALLRRILPPELASLVTALATAELTVDLGATAYAELSSPASGARETVYAVPPHTYGEGEPVPGSTPVAVPYASTYVAVEASSARLRITALGVLPVDLSVNVGRLDLSSILDQVAGSVIGSSVGGVVDNVNQVLAPVSALLGIRTGGADLFGVPRPSCTVPRLAG